MNQQTEKQIQTYENGEQTGGCQRKGGLEDGQNGGRQREIQVSSYGMNKSQGIKGRAYGVYSMIL